MRSLKVQGPNSLLLKTVLERPARSAGLSVFPKGSERMYINNYAATLSLTRSMLRIFYYISDACRFLSVLDNQTKYEDDLIYILVIVSSSVHSPSIFINV